MVLVEVTLLKFLLDNVTKLIKENAKPILELEKGCIYVPSLLKGLGTEAKQEQYPGRTCETTHKHDAEDAQETYVSYVHRQKYQSTMKKIFSGAGYGLNLRDVAQEIRSIGGQVKEMYNRLLFDPSAAVQSNDHPITQNTIMEVPSVEEDCVVGF